MPFKSQAQRRNSLNFWLHERSRTRHLGSGIARQAETSSPNMSEEPPRNHGAERDRCVEERRERTR